MTSRVWHMFAVMTWLALPIACQGEGTPPPRPATPEAGAPVTPSDGEAGEAGEVDGDPAGEPVVPDVTIDELGAIPAWQAVVDRDRYLLRRNQHGVVYGRVGPAITIAADAGAVPTGKVWLVDDTEGNGALAIRIAWPAKATAPAEGDRVAAGGAWTLDDERQWFWQADAISALPPAPPSTIPEPPAAPGHLITTGDPPSGWRPVATGKDDGVISFQVIGTPPVNEGDGWRIANELGDDTVAILLLPGERPSYGGHDLRAPDEKWRLKRGVDFWVRIGKIRRRSPEIPPTITARTAPVRW
jgi:hypothetical protein